MTNHIISDFGHRISVIVLYDGGCSMACLRANTPEFFRTPRAMQPALRENECLDR